MTLTAVFGIGGAFVFGVGFAIRRKFREPEAREFREFRLGAQGLLEYLGLVLMICGAISIGLTLCLPLILK